MIKVLCWQRYYFAFPWCDRYRLTDTTFLNPVISPEPQGDQIHLNVVKAFDLHKLKLTQKDDLLELKYYTGSMPLLSPKTCFKTCGCPEVLTSTTIYKKCGVKTHSGRQARYILKAHLELP